MQYLRWAQSQGLTKNSCIKIGRRAFSLYQWSLHPQASIGHSDQQRTPGLQLLAEGIMREKRGVCIQHFCFSEHCLRNWFLSLLTWNTDVTGKVWCVGAIESKGKQGQFAVIPESLKWCGSWHGSVLWSKGAQLTASPLGRREKSRAYVPQSSFLGAAQRTGFYLICFWSCELVHFRILEATREWWRAAAVPESLHYFRQTLEGVRNYRLLKSKSANLWLGNYTHSQEKLHDPKIVS